MLLATGAATAGLAFATSGTAGALPNCGGNNDVKVAPLSCTNTRTIDGTTFTVVLDVNAAGAMTVTYTLDAPRSTDTPIRVRAHRGISSNPNTNEVAGTIPAGATSAVLAVQTNCGQVDVKAVFTGNGDARGRVRRAVHHDGRRLHEHADDGGDDRPADHRPDHRPDHQHRRFHDPELGGRHDAARPAAPPRPPPEAPRSATVRCPRPAPMPRCCSP